MTRHDRSTTFRMSAGAGVLGAMLLAIGASAPATAQTPPAPLTITPVPSAPIADGFTLALAGDLIYLRPMLATLERQAPDILQVLREANVAFGNFETTAIDLGRFKGSPQAESGGTWLFASPATVTDVAAMGFDILSHANNHATDWGEEGLAETLDHLDAAKLVHAGTGASMSAARAPRYLDTNWGRIGLVAAATTFTPMSRASDPLGEVPGRPGVNGIRTVRSALVSPENLRVLASIAGTDPTKPVNLMGGRFRAMEGAPAKLSYSYELNERDQQANMTAVRQAHQNGNLAIFSLHNHEPSNESETPADFAQPMARKMIDSGADVVVGHGPHQLRGIEIYKGKVIFYSLGNFAMMNNSLDQLPADVFDQYGVEPGSTTTPELLQSRNTRSFADARFYESVIARMRYMGGKVSEIRLYPIDLGVELAGATRGVPRTASKAIGQRILERLQGQSAAFGTKIAIENGVGVIRLPAN
jgi:poly-gamma-glutamate capsule biosynthesis protein CapA/YwtB (metallophosphatase superfamily)